MPLPPQSSTLDQKALPALLKEAQRLLLPVSSPEMLVPTSCRALPSLALTNLSPFTWMPKTPVGVVLEVGGGEGGVTPAGALEQAGGGRGGGWCLAAPGS